MNRPDQGTILPACGGTEVPSVINGRRWLYVWQPSSGRHGWLNMETDVVTWHREFHPAWAPQFENMEEEEPAPRSAPAWGSGLHW